MLLLQLNQQERVEEGIALKKEMHFFPNHNISNDTVRPSQCQVAHHSREPIENYHLNLHPPAEFQLNRLAANKLNVVDS